MKICKPTQIQKLKIPPTELLKFYLINFINHKKTPSLNKLGVFRRILRF